MSLYQDLFEGRTKLSLVGLGYVGMPIAVEFAKHVPVVGFDINEQKIAQYMAGVDPTNEVGGEAVASSGIEFTSDPARLEEARFHIVAVPTPVNQDKTPDLSPVEGASRTLGKHLKPGSIVVYESTVYPGVTEDVCVPILEEESGLKCGVDFKVGYSPERINPGDRVHTLTTIRKIVSGMDAESLEEIKSVYDIVIEAGTYPVSTIKTAEAIKVVENSQRDINIAFMNELAMVFDRMGIDTSEVVDGMNTKWNALGFRPGLVGGHCIGVDPLLLHLRGREARLPLPDHPRRPQGQRRHGRVRRRRRHQADGARGPRPLESQGRRPRHHLQGGLPRRAQLQGGGHPEALRPVRHRARRLRPVGGRRRRRARLRREARRHGRDEGPRLPGRGSRP